jgi:hypothetical protein
MMLQGKARRFSGRHGRNTTLPLRNMCHHSIQHSLARLLQKQHSMCRIITLLQPNLCRCKARTLSSTRPGGCLQPAFYAT